MKWTSLKLLSHVFSLTNKMQQIMPYKLEKFSNCIHMYVSSETCHFVYLELGLNFQILFQSQTMRCLRGMAEPEVSD